MQKAQGRYFQEKRRRGEKWREEKGLEIFTPFPFLNSAMRTEIKLKFCSRNDISSPPVQVGGGGGGDRPDLGRTRPRLREEEGDDD